jgi:nitroreductase
MRAVENEALVNQLKWRYATKKFDSSRKISAEDWNTLEEALILTPSSYGLEPWHFTVITSQAVKEQLVPAAYGQTQVAQASHVVVMAVNRRIDAAYVDQFISRVSQTRNVPLEKLEGYKNVIKGSLSRQDSAATETWSARQVYIALGTLLTCAALLGIDSGPMEGIQPAKIDEILGLDKRGFATLCVCTLGYRAADDHSAKHAKVRFKPHEVVTHIA